MAHIHLSEDQFFETFKPVQNHFEDADPDVWRGCMFETFGAELDHVLSVANTTPNLVWTIVEGDDGNLIVGDGYHLINRIGYFICEVPFDSENTYDVFDEEFSDIQRAVIESYDDGDNLVSGPEDVEHCGDDLLKFLLIELSSKEGCTDSEEAIRRIDTAIRQLQAVQSALEDL